MRHCSFWATLAVVSAVHGVALADAPDGDETRGGIDPTSAESDESPAFATAPVNPRWELLIHGYFGAQRYVRDPREGGVSVDALGGVEVAYRHGYLIGAAFGQMGAFSPFFVSGGLAGGIALHTMPGPRLDLLIAGGLDGYMGWGAAFLGDDPGVNKVLPFVGPRVRVAQTFGSGRGHFEVGLLVGWETNPWRPEVTYTYTEHSLLGCWETCSPPATHEVHRVVGGSRAIAALTLGFALDGT
jgi:hypothetical protein